MLFIDGDHEYESIRHDFEAWSRFVVPHGYICIHDVSNYDSIARYYQEILRDRNAFREVATVVSMKVLERTF